MSAIFTLIIHIQVLNVNDIQIVIISLQILSDTDIDDMHA